MGAHVYLVPENAFKGSLNFANVIIFFAKSQRVLTKTVPLLIKCSNTLIEAFATFTVRQS